MARTRTRKSNRLVKTTLAVIVILAVAGGLYAWHHNNTKPVNVSVNKTWQPAPKNNDITKANPLNPNNNDSSSNSNESQPNNVGSASSSKQQVSPSITTYSEQNNELIVNGFVAGVVENGGTCTLKLVKGSAVVTQSRQGVVSATNTSCGQTDVPLSKLSTGVWQATLSYSSSTSEGTSAATNITIQ